MAVSGSSINQTGAGLRIGTRGSPLALTQAEMVKAALIAAHPGLSAGDLEIVPIRTTGDKVQDRTLATIGGKGLFTKEIEEALIDGRVDLAVHSMKDMPTFLPDGLIIAAMLEREDPAAVIDHRRGGLVAARFDAQNDHGRTNIRVSCRSP